MPPEALDRIVAAVRAARGAPARAAARAQAAARPAGDAGAELDREVRAADAGSGPGGQLALDQ